MGRQGGGWGGGEAGGWVGRWVGGSGGWRVGVGAGVFAVYVMHVYNFHLLKNMFSLVDLKRNASLLDFFYSFQAPEPNGR